MEVERGKVERCDERKMYCCLTTFPTHRLLKQHKDGDTRVLESVEECERRRESEKESERERERNCEAGGYFVPHTHTPSSLSLERGYET